MKETTANPTIEMLLERRNEAIPRGPFNVAPIFVDRARGAGLWDVAGKRYTTSAAGSERSMSGRGVGG